MHIEKTLEELGLEEKRGKIYLATLELGTAKAQDIAKKAGVLRTTAYEILDSLVREGLIAMSAKGRIRIFIAEPPTKLLTALKDKEKKLAAALPELESIYNVSATKPRVRFYEGVTGIKTVYEDTLSVRDKNLRGILSMQDLFTIPGREYMDDYVKRRIATGVKLRVIRSETKEVEEIWPTSMAELRELRYAPRNMEFAMTMYLYDNKVSLIGTKKENFGMIIESENFYHIQKNMFDVLWDVSRTTPRKA